MGNLADSNKYCGDWQGGKFCSLKIRVGGQKRLVASVGALICVTGMSK